MIAAKNRQKISDIVVNNVLGFIKPFASKRLLLGIEKLLTYCCDITIIDVDAVAGATETDITVTLSKPVNFLELGVAILYADGVPVATTSFSNGDTIFFNEVPLASGSTDFKILLQLPTDFSLNTGVFQISNEVTATVPA